MEKGCSCASNFLYDALNRELSVAGPNHIPIIPHSPDHGSEES